MIFLLTAALAGPCTAPGLARPFNDSVTAAANGLTDLDKPALVANALAAKEALPCVVEALIPTDIANYFVVAGLIAYMEDDDRDAARRNFEAAKSAFPAVELPRNQLPHEHPIQQLFRGSSSIPGRTEPAPSNGKGWSRVNGVPNGAFPLGRPWVLQRVAADGRVQRTVLVDGAIPGPKAETSSGSASGHLAVALGFWRFSNASKARNWTMVRLRGGLPLRTWLDATASVTAGLYLGAEGTRVLPAPGLGLRAHGSGTLQPTVGLTVDLVLSASTPDQPGKTVLNPAFGLPLGLVYRPGSVGLEAELLPTLGGSQDGDGLRVSTRASVGLVLSL